ncbi:MFS transporter [Bradyrhizobium ivorense]|uniref:MFS transporter n=1 Tax=Bradyrhizobium ivorense TaxID=2511166 RepID=UPI0010BA28E0|nr:MFS transporter [Bradyrhizobium ivorense]VIO81372.1 Purine efflux pump PbuE [Bradyrhizobium ivorense]
MTLQSSIAASALSRALAALAAATAVIVATEFIVVGLLPVLARDLAISPAVAGHLVGAFALSASLLGPPLTIAAAAIAPRTILTATLGLYAATDLAAVLWPDYSVMLTMRIVQGAALPVFVSVGAAAVTTLAPPARRGRVLALANTGFAVGIVAALPAGVALAERGQWTPSFVALAAVSLAAAVLLLAVFPERRPEAPRASAAARLLRAPAFQLQLALSVAVFVAMFSAYTYISLWLAEVAGLDTGGIALALVGFGAAGVLGNTAAAWIADRGPLRATAVAVTALVLAVLGLSLAATPVLRLVLFVAWGIFHTACVALCQVRVSFAGREAPAFAMAMNISAANLGIALGAVAGGCAVERWGVSAIGWPGLAMLPLLLGLALAIRTIGPRRSFG